MARENFKTPVFDCNNSSSVVEIPGRSLFRSVLNDRPAFRSKLQLIVEREGGEY